MFCPKCGKEIGEKARFCPYCGQALFLPAEEGKGRESISPGVPERVDEKLSEYYRKKFKIFDQNNGKFVPTWNWASFLFGGLWYLVKGIWGKALVMIILSIVFEGIPIPFFWIYCGLFGNWDYYLLKRKRTQWWG